MTRSFTKTVCMSVFALCTFFSISSYAEGTKQLAPITGSGDTSVVMLHTNADSTGNFAEYNGSVVSRLNLRIADASETVYIGLSREYDDFGNPDGIGGVGTYCFRIKDPNGNVVHGPFSINSGNANADSWLLASSGPDVLNAMDGYDTSTEPYATFDPAMTGDYYIEFTDNPTNCDVASPGNQVNIKFFDITVVSGGAEQPGRLWSLNWALVSPPINPNMPPECQFDRPFNGVLFSYTTDGFVSKIDFDSSGFQGLQFTVAFGERGPSNLGDVLLDRMSVNNADSTSSAADHMVFVNEPDELEFPSSMDICGDVALLGVVCVADTFCFNVGITRPGQIEIILDFDGDGEFTDDSIDVILATILDEADTVCISWNGLMGDGNPPGFGESLPAIVRYSQGVQHYAAYDVELLKFGFCVETVRPVCPGIATNLLYWDDSNISDDVNTPNYDESVPGTGQPVMQLNGCECQEDLCRTWTNVHIDADTSCVGQITGYGDQNTLNTWWFASTTIIGPLELPFVSVDISGDSVICEGESTEFFAMGLPDSIDFIYEWSGPNGFVANTESTGPISDPGAYYVTATDTIADCSAIDSLVLVVNAIPEITLSFECVGPNQPNGNIELTVVGDDPFTYEWSNGAMTEDLDDVPPGTYIVTVTDEAGCEAVDSITVEGCCELVVTCPPADGGTFGCIDDIPAPDSTLVIVTDYCEPLSIDITDESNGGSGCAGDPEIVTRTYNVTDGAGGATSCVQTYTVVDDVLPTITCPADATVNCDEAPDTTLTGSPIVGDNCTATVDLEVSFEDAGTPGTCITDEPVIRTWTVTDACGNTATCTQSIFFQDIVAPVLDQGSCPEDITVECDDKFAIGTPTYTDNCSDSQEIVVTSRIDSLGFSGACLNNIIGVVTYTFFAEDICGNIDSSCVTTVTYQDTEAPTFTAPGDITLDCTESDLSPENTGEVLDTLDNCTDITLTFEDLVVPADCPALDSIYRTWTATDACGNSSTDVQIIVTFDFGAPTFTTPADITIDCDASTDPTNTGEILDTLDACGADITVDFDDVVEAGACVGESTITRTWIVTDECLNSSTGVQVITLIDTIGPGFQIPVDTTIDCTSGSDPGLLGAPDLITDNCSLDFATTYSDDVVPGECPATDTIYRTWFVSDDCGNSSTGLQTIVLIDTIAPAVESCPADAVVNCNEPLGLLGEPEFLDACLDATYTFTDDTVGYNPPDDLGMIVRTFYVEDACGNVDSSCIQNIVIQDTIAPEILTCPGEITVVCIEDADTSNTGLPTYTDQCFDLEDLTLAFADVVDAVGGDCSDATITRTFYISDPEGNVDSSCVQVITVADDVAPSIVCPAAVSVSCASQVPPADILLISSSDNCGGDVTITVNPDVISNMTCANRFTISRVYVATDGCGNSATCEQIITVNDIIVPTITCPGPQTVSCATQIPAVNTGSVSASDNCGGAPTITFISDVTVNQTCPNRFQVNRTYRATDACGNTAQCVQVITVNDVTAPTIVCPADMSVEEVADTAAVVTGTPTGTDNCGGGVTFSYDDVILPGECEEQFGVERTWTATDACGNTATCLQLIAVDAGCLCELICPADITLNLDPGACEAIISYNPPMVLGDCDFDLSTPTTITQNSNTTLIQDALQCGVNPTSHWRAYDLAAIGASGDFEMNSLGMASWSAGTVQIYVYTYTGTLPSNTLDVNLMTLVGQSNATNVGAFALSTINLTAPAVIPEGSKFVVEQRQTAGGPWCIAANYAGNSQPAYMNCIGSIFGFPAIPTSYNDLGYGFIHPIQVLNGSLIEPGVVIVQTEGLPSGSVFPIGTTTNCFEMIDGETGEVLDSCCFNIVVVEHPFSIPPACNDLVQVSVDANCEAQICADMILEGGPYGCYDDYIVTTDQYGPDVDVNCISLNYTPGLHQVTITDPETGNSCWGEFLIEDKLPPTITCLDFTLTCGQDLTPVFSPPIMGTNICSAFPGLPIGPNAGVITESTCTVSLPQGVEILDVNVCVKVTHTWIGDCNTDVISPSGAVTNLWGFGQCGATDNMHQKFDDAGPLTVLCADINDGCDFILQPVSFQLGGPPLAQYNGTNPNGVWTLMITDNAGGDGGTLDEWHLEIEYAQNAPFAPAVDDNCDEELDLVYSDEEIAGDLCDTIVIERTWIVTDDAGNSASCVQTLYVEPLTLDGLQCPENYVGECGQSADPDVTGWPQVDGIDIVEGGFCNLFVGYWDKELLDCGNGTKIIRTWTILDWCTQELEECEQIIKLSDEQPPVLECPADQTVSTDPWFCDKDVVLELPEAEDLCGTPFTLTPSVSAGTLVHFGGDFWRVDNLPVGVHTVTWTAEDACGNDTTCTYTITVADLVPPVPLCDEHTVLTLTFDDPLDEGLTKLHATTLDDGSYDNCGPVTFLARRMDSCIDFDWIGPNGEYPNNDGGQPESIDRGLTFQTWVPFACCDVAQYHMVELRVTDQSGNVNSCMVEVYVQDKLPPFIVCPPDITVSCEFWFDAHETDGFEPADGLENVFGRVLDAYDYEESDRQYVIIDDPGNTDLPQPYHWGLDGWADDNCDVTIDVRTRVFDDCSGEDLPSGAPDWAVRLVERTFRAQDGQGNTSTCRQRIWVVDFDPFYITDVVCGLNNADDVRWPCDLVLTDCPEGDLTPENLSAYAPNNAPVVNDDNCSVIGVHYDDQIFYFVDNACYKIIRTWTVIDWCQYDPIEETGIWHYTQVIKVHDEEGPEFENCPDEPVTYCAADSNTQLPSNNQVFLGEDDPNSSACSIHVWEERVVHETCSDIVIYDVKIYPYNGAEYVQIVDKTEVDVDTNGDAVLRWDTRQNSLPSNHSIRRYGLPYNDRFCSNWPLPGGVKDYHRVLWSVEDGCGNLTTCEYLLRLEDCKQPTPICVGLSSVVMPTSGSVTIWAKDFDSGSTVDDCTAHEDLLFSFSGDVYEPSREFNCETIEANGSPSFLVEIWVADEGNDQNCNGFVQPLGIEWSERNKDYCTTFIVIDDNEDVCGGGIGVAGQIETENVEAVELVHVGLKDAHGNLVSTHITDEDGRYHFNNPLLNYIIEPYRNDNHKNGVSTLDLVEIQKHLLGIKVLSSPYKMIAADANSSESVSSLDLVEIRKLILGLQSEFERNTSWRFVDGAYVFPNPVSPWPFPETIVVEDGMTLNEDFVAVKIGDVNGTVVANANQVVVRNARQVLNMHTAEQLVKAGEEVIVPVFANNFEAITGFQFTMELQGLTYSGIESAALDVPAEFIGNHENALTMSWVHATDLAAAVSVQADEVLFYVRFVATQNGSLSEMLKITSEITEAEGYTEAEGETLFLDIALQFTSNIPGAGLDYALYQNEPNPFVDQTMIGFDLPAAMPVTLTVYDIHGRAVRIIEGEYDKGYNEILLKGKELKHGGAYYYRLNAGDFTASKKLLFSGE